MCCVSSFKMFAGKKLWPVWCKTLYLDVQRSFPHTNRGLIKHPDQCHSQVSAKDAEESGPLSTIQGPCGVVASALRCLHAAVVRWIWHSLCHLYTVYITFMSVAHFLQVKSNPVRKEEGKKAAHGAGDEKSPAKSKTSAKATPGEWVQEQADLLVSFKPWVSKPH